MQRTEAARNASRQARAHGHTGQKRAQASRASRTCFEIAGFGRLVHLLALGAHAQLFVAVVPLLRACTGQPSEAAAGQRIIHHGQSKQTRQTTRSHGAALAHTSRSQTTQHAQRRACNARRAAGEQRKGGFRTVILVLSCDPRSSHTKNSSNTTARQLGSCTRTETRNRHELRMGKRGIIKWRH